MQFTPLHSWEMSPAAARELQKSLAGSVDVSRPLGDWTTLAAADVSFNRYGVDLFAAVVVVKRQSFEVIERVGVSLRESFPYVPGLLSFRELPPLLAAFEKLETRPDVILCDGQGIAHPRRLGIASHLGLWLGVPTIGCAKSLLCGNFVQPGLERGESTELTDHGDVIGRVVRTKNRVKPLFVSAGHLCDLDSAVSVVLETAPRFRLPTPARMAHEFVNQVRRESTRSASGS